ncbi:hypothetical protein CEXT_475511 [Caerostris extrusa]|uniref:Uncharacterized protein n=1 Tax=Caerostris extrusa TaxID=172846 RepID=A0AAV4XDG9_CAEEX|nr:hypothetical protein CEXT_475511 [Caerostris extrusa]
MLQDIKSCMPSHHSFQAHNKNKGPQANISTKRRFLKALQESQRTELSPHCLYGKGRKVSIYRKWNSIHIHSSSGGKDFDPEKVQPPIFHPTHHHKKFYDARGKNFVPNM